MGYVSTITATSFPKQSDRVGQKINIASHVGTILRDDLETPHRTIVQLDDGRYVAGVGLLTDTYPEQDNDLIGKRVAVIFHRRFSSEFQGIIVRYDLAAPLSRIIKLDNGLFVETVECQWTPKRED